MLISYLAIDNDQNWEINNTVNETKDPFQTLPVFPLMSFSVPGSDMAFGYFSLTCKSATAPQPPRVFYGPDTLGEY